MTYFGQDHAVKVIIVSRSGTNTNDIGMGYCNKFRESSTFWPVCTSLPGRKPFEMEFSVIPNRKYDESH